MIAKMSLLSAALLSLVACGGDDGGGIKLVDAKVADAKVFMDAKMCATPATFSGGTIGSATMTSPGQFFVKNMTTNVVSFAIAITISKQTDALKDILYVQVPTPANGFMANVPYNFATDATNVSGAAAIALLDGDTPMQGADGTMTLFPENGNITFSQVGLNNGDNVFFTIGMANYKEIDADGNQVAGGCASNLGNITIFGKQNAAAPTRMVPTNPQTDTTTTSARKLDVHQLALPFTLN